MLHQGTRRDWNPSVLLPNCLCPQQSQIGLPASHMFPLKHFRQKLAPINLGGNKSCYRTQCSLSEGLLRAIYFNRKRTRQNLKIPAKINKIPINLNLAGLKY